MSAYPYESVKVDWKRPAIDRDVLRECTARSDLKGWWHGLGNLAILRWKMVSHVDPRYDACGSGAGE